MLGLGLGLNYNKYNSIKTSKSFIFDVSVTDTFSLPLELTGTYNFKVYWGDGSYSTITAYNQAEVTHTYSAAGNYTVIINGTLIGWCSNNTWTHRTNITNIKQWGTVRMGNSGGYFRGCSNLTITATDVLDLTGMTTMARAFAGCSKITTIPSLTSWNTANIVSMDSMFYTCTLFNQSLAGLNMSSNKNLNSFLNTCTAFNGSVANLDVSKVTNFISVFNGCTSFNQPLTGWNTSAGTAFTSIIQTCNAFKQNISNLNLTSVPASGNAALYVTATDITTTNYDLLLIALAAQAVNANITFSVGATKYTGGGAAETARTYLSSTKGWIITDGGAV